MHPRREFINIRIVARNFRFFLSSMLVWIIEGEKQLTSRRRAYFAEGGEKMLLAGETNPPAPRPAPAPATTALRTNPG
jgi:hypothetical protein